MDQTRRRTLRRCIALAACLMAIGLAVQIIREGRAYCTAMPNPRIDYVARLEEEFGRPHGTNAAPIYWRAIDHIEVPAPDSDSAVRGLWSSEVSRTVAPSSIIRAWLAQQAEAIDESASVELPGNCWPTRDLFGDDLLRLYHVPFDCPPIPLAVWLDFAEQAFWSPAALLAHAWGHRAWLASERGDFQEARACYGRALRIVRHLYLSPNALIAAEAEIRAHQRWAGICYKYPAAVHLGLPEELGRLAAVTSIHRVLRCSELELEDGIQRYHTDDGRGSGHQVIEIKPVRPAYVLRNLKGLIRPSRAAITAQVREAFVALSKLANQPAGSRTAPQWFAALNARVLTDVHTAGVGFGSGYSPPRLAYLPSHLAAAQGVRAGIVRLRQVQEFRIRTGRLPDSLDDLPPLESFIGPQMGALPLVYKRTGDRFVMYSTGQNGADNGGPVPPATGTNAAQDDIAIWPPADEDWTLWRETPPSPASSGPAQTDGRGLSVP